MNLLRLQQLRSKFSAAPSNNCAAAWLSLFDDRLVLYGRFMMPSLHVAMHVRHHVWLVHITVINRKMLSPSLYIRRIALHPQSPRIA